MNLDLTDEQRLLSETVERFVAANYDFRARDGFMRAPDGFSRAVWGEMAELGLLALPFEEADGGFGGGGVETMLVMEAFGKGLVVEPYLATIVLAGTALRLAASDAQKASRLPGVMQGDRLMALAHGERGAPRHALSAIRTTARKDGAGWVLEGAKSAVLHGDVADELVVSAATDAGVTLFLVRADSPGFSRHGRPTYDGRRLADVTLERVRLDAECVLGEIGGGVDVLERVFEAAIAAVAAEAVGLMATTLDTTVEYLKTRKQFGVAIGSFQALQHRAVEMLIQVELARSMALLAAVSLPLEDPDRRARNIAAAKVQIGRSGRFIGQQAVQLHGAIGITSEYKVGHAFKRLTAIDTLFGDADYHLDVLAHAGGLH